MSPTSRGKRVIGYKLPVQTTFRELDEEGKIMLEPEATTEKRTLSYEIDQF